MAQLTRCLLQSMKCSGLRSLKPVASQAAKMLPSRMQSHMRQTPAQCPQSSLFGPRQPPAAAGNSKANGAKRREILQAVGVGLGALGFVLGGFALDRRIEFGQSVLITMQPGREVVLTSGVGTRVTAVSTDIAFDGGLVQIVESLMACNRCMNTLCLLSRRMCEQQSLHYPSMAS